MMTTPVRGRLDLPEEEPTPLEGGGAHRPPPPSPPGPPIIPVDPRYAPEEGSHRWMLWVVVLVVVAATVAAVALL